MQEKRKRHSVINPVYAQICDVSEFSRTGDGKEITANHYHHSTYLSKD